MIGFLAFCVFGYFVVGDLFHHLPGGPKDPEAELRRRRPLSEQDAPSWRFNVDGARGDYIDDDPRHLTD